MDLAIKDKFIEKWDKYFPGEKLPVACWYAIRRDPILQKRFD